MFRIGLFEGLVILVITLLVIGPTQIPKLAKVLPDAITNIMTGISKAKQPKEGDLSNEEIK